MTAYYSEFDPFAAAWLCELIKQNLIAPGDVDERDIRDVTPDDLRGYTQCHFFAGIGGWSYALRLAGWPDDRPVWTGSCPCQPFSAAGKGGGFADERHLWPEFYRLIGQHRPAVVFGEQVASAPGLQWLDLVQADLEAAGYAVGAVDTCAAGVGAPHIRQRLYWVADAGSARLSLGSQPDDGRGIVWQQGQAPAESGTLGRPGPTNGHWRDADWLGCTDGRWRPVESRSQSVVDGLSSRVGLGSDARQKAQEEIDDWCSQAKVGPGEAMSNLRVSLTAQAQRERAIRGPDGIPSASILLAFLRQLTLEGWPFAKRIPCTGPEAQEEAMRMLRRQDQASGSPRQRGLAEQQTEQSSDSVRVLSSILARHAQSAWPEAVFADAQIGFPLSHGIPNRVGSLRGYGNAIVPQVAAEFIAAYLEATA